MPFLFKLKITDYKGWAHGLKKAGYATDPRYAYRLIDIIELYNLHKFDTRDGIKWMKEFPNPHQPYWQMICCILWCVAEILLKVCRKSSISVSVN